MYFAFYRVALCTEIPSTSLPTSFALPRLNSLKFHYLKFYTGYFSRARSRRERQRRDKGRKRWDWDPSKNLKKASPGSATDPGITRTATSLKGPPRESCLKSCNPDNGDSCLVSQEVSLSICVSLSLSLFRVDSPSLLGVRRSRCSTLWAVRSTRVYVNSVRHSERQYWREHFRTRVRHVTELYRCILGDIWQRAVTVFRKVQVR